MTGPLDRLAAYVRRETGLALDGAQLSSLRGAVERLEPAGPAALLRRLDDRVDGPALTARLVDEVTVKETFFFRHPEELEAIDWRALSEAARRRGDARVRVWVTACATGEEAWTLAMLALEAFWPRPAPVEIVATDIAPGALARAAAGRYGPRAVARVSPGRRARWMTPHGDGLRVGDELRALVRFARHNLVRDPAPPLGHGRFDLITCRNVLIYFALPDVAAVVGRLRSALHPGGTLVLGAADRLSERSAVGAPARAPALAPSAAPRAARPARAAQRAPAGREPPAPGLQLDAVAQLGDGRDALDR
ncbi:MAG TPA: CheR family methyltransferase, partial [Capillimicrobium sp.]